MKTLKEVVDKYDSGYADFQKKWDETFMNLQSRYQDAISLLNSTTDKLTGKKIKSVNNYKKNRWMERALSEVIRFLDEGARSSAQTYFRVV